MKKLIVPALAVLFAVGLSQRQAKAGFSIGISIGDSYRHASPAVVAPPQIISQAPVVVTAPGQVACEPAPVVVAPAPVVVAPYETYPVIGYGARWDYHRRDYRGYRDYHSHSGYRDEHRGNYNHELGHHEGGRH